MKILEDLTIRSHRVYHEGYKPSPESIGSLSLTGGTITGALKLKGTTMTSTINCNRLSGREELQIYSAGDAYMEGSKGSGIHLYGNNDIEHAGNIAFLTGDNNSGTARLIISQKGNATFGGAIWDFVDTDKDIGLINIRGVTGKTAMVFHSVAKEFGEIAVPSGENFAIGTLDVTTNSFTCNLEISALGNVGINQGELFVKNNRVYHTGNIPTAIEVGALPIRGGAVSGEIQMSGNPLRLTTSIGHGRIGFDSGTNDVYISNSANNWLRLKDDRTMTYAGHKVYTSGDKPTPEEIGAASISGGRRIFCQTAQPTATAVGDIWISW